MRFLIDENLPADIAYGLIEQGHGAIAVVASDLKGWKDPELWLLAATEERILITEDKGFPLRIDPKPAGLVLIRYRNAFDVDVVIRNVLGLVQSMGEDLIGKNTVMEPGRVRISEL